MGFRLCFLLCMHVDMVTGGVRMLPSASCRALDHDLNSDRRIEVASVCSPSSRHTCRLLNPQRGERWRSNNGAGEKVVLINTG